MAKKQAKDYDLKNTGAVANADAVADFMGAAGAAPDLSGFEEKSLPPIIKPRDMKTGMFLRGRVLKAVASSQKSIKSPLVYIAVYHPVTGEDLKRTIAFPLVACVKNAFDIPVSEEATPEHVNNSFIGFEILLEKTGVAAPQPGRKKGAHLFRCMMKPPGGKAR